MSMFTKAFRLNRFHKMIFAMNSEPPVGVISEDSQPEVERNLETTVDGESITGATGDAIDDIDLPKPDIRISSFDDLNVFMSRAKEQCPEGASVRMLINHVSTDEVNTPKNPHAYDEYRQAFWDLVKTTGGRSSELSRRPYFAWSSIVYLSDDISDEARTPINKLIEIGAEIWIERYPARIVMPDDEYTGIPDGISEIVFHGKTFSVASRAGAAAMSNMTNELGVSIGSGLFFSIVETCWVDRTTHQPLWSPQMQEKVLSWRGGAPMEFVVKRDLFPED